MDYTFIHFSACADVEHATWSGELVSALGVDRSKLPEIVEPWRLVGELTDKSAHDFGLAPGTRVAAGCGTRLWRPRGGYRPAGHALRYRGHGQCPGRQHFEFCTRYPPPHPSEHAFGHPRAVESPGLHRRRRAGAALVPDQFFTPSPGRMRQTPTGFMDYWTRQPLGYLRGTGPVLLTAPGWAYLPGSPRDARRLAGFLLGSHTRPISTAPSSRVSHLNMLST